MAKFLIFLRLELCDFCINLRNKSAWHRVELFFWVFLRQESTTFCVNYPKFNFFTIRCWEIGFFFFFIFLSVGPGREGGRGLFWAKLEKVNAHQDQTHLSSSRYAILKCGRIKPFEVSLLNLIFRETNAPSWIRALSDLDLAWILLMPDLNLTMSGLSLSEILPVSELRPAWILAKLDLILAWTQAESWLNPNWLLCFGEEQAYA